MIAEACRPIERSARRRLRDKSFALAAGDERLEGLVLTGTSHARDRSLAAAAADDP